MDNLKPPQSHHLSAAEGWVELGNPAEARAELAQLEESWRLHPSVLSVQWTICAEEKNWPEALLIARLLTHISPESPAAWLHQAYALRRVPEGGLQPAWEALLPALKKFPKVAIIAYNLACYACQLGHLDSARELLKSSIRIGKRQQFDRIRQMALQDDDLEPLWPEISDM